MQKHRHYTCVFAHTNSVAYIDSSPAHSWHSMDTFINHLNFLLRDNTSI